MNKTDVINKVAESTGASKKDTEAIVNETFQTIIDSVVSGEKVQIAGFGIFEKKSTMATMSESSMSNKGEIKWNVLSVAEKYTRINFAIYILKPTQVF